MVKDGNLNENGKMESIWKSCLLILPAASGRITGKNLYPQNAKNNSWIDLWYFDEDRHHS